MNASVAMMPSRSRPSRISRCRSFDIAELSRKDMERMLSVIPFEGPRRELCVISKRVRNTALRPDECEVMKSLMQRAEPSIPQRPGKPGETESADKKVMEDHPYIRNLVRAIDEGVMKKRKPPLKNQASAKEAAERIGASHISHPPHVDSDAGAASVEGTVTSQEDALHTWMREQQQCGYIENGVQPFSSGYSLLNSLNKGRFPMDANEPLSMTVRSLANKYELFLDRAFLTTNEATTSLSSGARSPRRTLMERLKEEPVRCWRSIRNITNVPPPRIAVGKRKGFRNVLDDCMVAEKWRHRFDHVNYMDQIKLDESLAMRDLCRKMVVHHETVSSGEPSFVALADMFDRKEERFSKVSCEGRLSRGKDFVMDSVWTQRANEISLERERTRLIDVIKSFKLQVVASLLSKEVVECMRDDLVKLLQQWPCNHRKRHIFTKLNFVEWVRRRYKLPPTVGNTTEPGAPSLLESMASSAEASFVEFVLQVLP